MVGLNVVNKAHAEVNDKGFISDVYVPKELRGRGLGHKLLFKITEDADLEGMDLSLRVFPGRDSEMTMWSLMKFYAQHGFRLKKFDCFPLMVRKCVPFNPQL